MPFSSVPPESPILPAPPRPRANTNTSPTKPSPACGIITHSYSAPYLPFHFGVEFEVLLRPRALLTQTDPLPDTNDPVRTFRQYSLRLREIIADLLCANDLPCNVYEGGFIDYSKWNATLDGSISKKHQQDGFFPMEIVSPLIKTDDEWVTTIDHFWLILLSHFELRPDTSCGFHIHISTITGRYNLEQLRKMAKAVVFWEPATARCAPLSRQDDVLAFCKSNLKSSVPVGREIVHSGRIEGLQDAFNFIDSASEANTIVDFVCPDKYRAWNLLPCGTGGHGSIEFRRPPGVTTAKKAKHWIAFTISFVELAITFDPSSLPSQTRLSSQLDALYSPELEGRLFECARRVHVYAQLDPRLRQQDDPRTLHITTMHARSLTSLQAIDEEYQLSHNA